MAFAFLGTGRPAAYRSNIRFSLAKITGKSNPEFQESRRNARLENQTQTPVNREQAAEFVERFAVRMMTDLLPRNLGSFFGGGNARVAQKRHRLIRRFVVCHDYRVF